MKRETVASSNVRSIGYDDAGQILEVEYTSGVYHYEKVPRAIFDELMAAESKGKFLAHVKKAYLGSRVDAVPVPNAVPDQSAALQPAGEVVSPAVATPRNFSPRV
jgi:hypothetical protein